MSSGTDVPRGGGVARVIGAWRAGNRAGDDVIRDRIKERSAWARYGLLGLVLFAVFTQQAVGSPRRVGPGSAR